MKTLALLLAFIGFAGASAQPLILNRQNFGAVPTGEQKDTIYVSSTPVARASAGIDQHWDYSKNIVLDTTIVNVRAASTLSQFPNSYARMNLFENLTSTRGYNYDEYYAITDTGVVSLGYNTMAQSWNIGDITMGANDSIYILNYSEVYDKPVLITPFPWTYGGTNISSRMIETQGRINIQAMNMSNIPIGKRSYVINYDTVAGWGTLVLPVDTGKSTPMPVLLVNSTMEVTDSIFVNGAPAAAPFLTAFGLTQGHYLKTSTQTFLRAGELNPVATLIFGVHEDSTEYFTFHSKLTPAQGGVFERATVRGLKAYPNPASTEVTIEVPGETTGRIYANILNTAGVSVAKATSDAGAGFRFGLPSSLAPGAYYILVRSESGKLLGAGSVIKN